jgi:hypothetical protein
MSGSINKSSVREKSVASWSLKPIRKEVNPIQEKGVRKMELLILLKNLY